MDYYEASGRGLRELVWLQRPENIPAIVHVTIYSLLFIICLQSSSQEKCIISLKVTSCLIWSPVTITSRRALENQEGFANKTEHHINKSGTLACLSSFLPEPHQTDFHLQGLLFNNIDSISHGPMLLRNVFKLHLLFCHCFDCET